MTEEDKALERLIKVCIKCNVPKQGSMFARDKRNRNGIKGTCKQCDSIRGKEAYHKDPEKARAKRVYKNYKISLEEYDKCMATSDCCEACERETDLVYEHNHSTGEFRGVLCRQCNAVLGLTGDNEETLRTLANYLKERGTYGKK